MFAYLLIVGLGLYIIFYAIKVKYRDTEILIGQKREIKHLGERIQEVLDTEKIEKRKNRQLSSIAREASGLLKEKRFKAAEKKFLGIVREDHKNLKAYQGLGLLYLEQGEYEGAVEAYSKVTELDPTNEAGFNNLGLALMNVKKYDEAVHAYEHAIALNNKVVHRYINLALAASKAQNHKVEISALEKAVSLEPKKEYIEKLIDAALAAGEESTAKKALLRLVEIEPNNLEAQRKLARLEVKQ